MSRRSITRGILSGGEIMERLMENVRLFKLIMDKGYIDSTKIREIVPRRKYTEKKEYDVGRKINLQLVHDQ